MNRPLTMISTGLMVDQQLSRHHRLNFTLHQSTVTTALGSVHRNLLQPLPGPGLCCSLYMHAYVQRHGFLITRRFM